MGKAIITTRTTGQIDAIRDGVNGLYVAPGDAAGWKTAINRLLRHPEEAERMGAQGRRDIETAVSLDHWVERIACQIYAMQSERAHRVT